MPAEGLPRDCCLPDVTLRVVEAGDCESSYFTGLCSASRSKEIDVWDLQPTIAKYESTSFPTISASMSTSSTYSAYQGEIFVNAGYKNVLLTVTTDPAKLEEQAKEHMSSRSYRFVAGAAGERATLEANRLAFRQ